MTTTTRTDAGTGRDYDRRDTSHRPANDHVGQLRRKINEPFWQKILLIVLASLLAWAAQPLAPITQARFVADSARRDNREARRDSIIDRIDSRVGILVCKGLPPAEQEACRK